MIRIESEYITTSKIKTIGLLLTALIFIVGGIKMIAHPWLDSVFPIFRNRTLVLIMAYINIFLFGLCFLFFSLQLFGYRIKENRIKIDETGITDKYRLGSFGHIPWSDIKEVKIKTYQTHRCLTILVNNPSIYIDRQRSLAERKESELKYNLTGSPIIITSGLLEPNIDKLKIRIETRLKEVNKGYR